MIIVRHRFGVLLTHRVCCLRIQWMMLAIGACLTMSAFAGLPQVMMYWGRHNECPSLVEMRSLLESASMFIWTSTKDAIPKKFWREKYHMQKFDCFYWFLWQIGEEKEKKREKEERNLIYFHFFFNVFSFEHQTTEIIRQLNKIPSSI